MTACSVQADLKRQQQALKIERYASLVLEKCVKMA